MVGPPAGTIRNVGSTSMPAKSTRTRFTAEDDRILLKWVTEARRDGKYVAGNTIYQALQTEVRRLDLKSCLQSSC